MEELLLATLGAIHNLSFYQVGMIQANQLVEVAEYSRIAEFH